MTTLKKWIHPKTGKLTRVYVERPGLRAKLWFEEQGRSFGARYHGNEQDFTVPVGGEPIHKKEAREALSDVSLDIDHCTWADIVARAN
jgi:hypothetical protein